MIIIPTRLPLSGPRPTFGIIIRAAGEITVALHTGSSLLCIIFINVKRTIPGVAGAVCGLVRNIILALLFVVMAAIIAGSRDTGGGRAGYHYWRMMTGIFG